MSEPTQTNRKKSRRRNGDGNTYRYKNGWRTVISHKGHTVTAMGRSEQESRRLAKEKIKALPIYDGSLVPAAAKLTTGEFLTNWINKKHKTSIAASTHRRYASLINVHIIPALGSIKIQAITKNHINALMLRLKGVGDPDFEVRAVPWLLWVHGLRPLKQLDDSAFLFRMRELSTTAINIGSVNKPIPAMPKVDVSSPDGIEQDLKRWDQARKSPISALVDGITTPEHGGPITGPPSTHPLDALTYGTTTENFDQNTKAYNLLMHHVRQAVVYMNDSNRQADRIMDIEWFLDRIREDLSAIAYFGDGGVLVKPNAQVQMDKE